jgi:hypothetical protein
MKGSGSSIFVHTPGSDSDSIQASMVVMFNILIGNMMDDTTPTALFSSRQPPGNERAPQESLVYWLLPTEAPSIPETCCRLQQMSCDTPHTLWNETELCGQLQLQTGLQKYVREVAINQTNSKKGNSKILIT